MQDIQIAIASHKPYWTPNDPMYIPVYAGAALKDGSIQGFRNDDEGDGGISELNPHLSELTVLYWAWKHLASVIGAPEAVGLVHYRRHFAGHGENGVLSFAEADDLIRKAPVVVPKERNYYIETLGSHYDHTFSPEHLDLLISTVAKHSPEYVANLYRHLTKTHGHMFNLFIMRSDILCSYCEWLFPILFDLEANLDYDGMTPFEARTPGRLSEYLLDVWLVTEQIPCVEQPVFDTEPVNWINKGGSFLAAKLFGRKYKQSF